MAKIERKYHKVFAENSANNGQFGSAQNGTKITTEDPETVQALQAWQQGWVSAVIGGNKLPPMEELQATSFVPSYHTGYMLQESFPTWQAEKTYYKSSFVKEGSKLFISVQDDNTGNALSESAWWKEYRRGDVWTVGSVKKSMLAPDAFALLNGNDWVQMNGADATGSIYEALTGNATVPDASGVFIRSVGGNAGAVGQIQEDATKQNGLLVSWSSANVTTGTKTVSWASANASTSSSSNWHYDASYANKTDYVNGTGTSTNGRRGAWNNSVTQTAANKYTTVGGSMTVNKNQMNSHQTAHSHTFNKNALNSGQSWSGDAETRPINMSLYFYMKIN